MIAARVVAVALALAGAAVGCATSGAAERGAGIRYDQIPGTAYAVIAEVRARPGKEAELRAATLPLVAQVRDEPNNLLYVLHEDRESPGHFVFYEIFATQADFEAHNATPHVQAWFAKLPELADGGVHVARVALLGNTPGQETPVTTPSQPAPTPPTPSGVKNIVLVHGAWADGSGWEGVYRALTERGYHVSIVQNPLTSLADDVAAVDRVLARQDGPVLLVGHSYGGIVITEAGDAANVAGLVFVTAFAPEAGESVSSLLAGDQNPAVAPSADGFLFFDPSVFPQAFAHDLGPERGAFLAAAQVPTAAVAFGTPVTKAAWHDKPSFFVVSSEDRIIPPAAQRQMAGRAKATVTEIAGSHALYISQPAAVADAIDAAARVTSR